MTTGNWTAELFAAIDSRDVDRFLSFLCADARFRFGNAPTVSGHEEIGAAVGGFYSSIKGLSHKVRNSWVLTDTVICEGEVCYTRHDQSTLTVPFADIFAMRDGKIADYQIYIDTSALYAPEG